MGLLWVWWTWYAPNQLPEVVRGRFGIWWFGLKDWFLTNPLFGPGPWAGRIPMLQAQQGYLPTKEIFMEAHNEYLQWLYEYGLLGFAILTGWLWRHRRMFTATGTVGCALLALAVNSGSFFTFHVASVALLGLVLVGLASSQDPGGNTA